MSTISAECHRIFLGEITCALVAIFDTYPHAPLRDAPLPHLRLGPLHPG